MDGENDLSTALALSCLIQLNLLTRCLGKFTNMLIVCSILSLDFDTLNTRTALEY